MTDYAQVLEKAADLIEVRGLAHGRLQDDKGRLCAWGAMRAANNHSRAYFPAEEAAVFVIKLLPPSVEGSIARWNDNAKKSAVVSKLRKAAVLARAATNSKEALS